jgi:hypothetical protein
LSARRPGEPVAQSVEHLTFNQGVMGSIPIGLTRDFKGLMATSIPDGLGQHTAGTE